MAGKTYGEYIADFEATRTSKSDQMKKVAQKALDADRTMDTAEKEEFDTLKGEIDTIDENIKSLKVLEGMDASSAKPANEDAKKKAAKSADSLNTIQVKNTEKLEPGIAFARLARVKALAFTGQAGIRDEVQIAKHTYPGDDKLIAALTHKAAVSAANTLAPTWAGNLINEGGAAFADFVEYLRPRSLFGRISDRLRRLPFDTPVLIQGSAGLAKWVKEGNHKPLTQWSYTRTKLSPLKVAAIAAATKETMMRASTAADALLRDELTRSVGATIDTTFISDAAAVSDESPAGILNGTAALTLSGGSDADAVRCDVSAFQNAFADNNLSLQGAFWIMPERVAIALSLMQNPLGTTAAFPGVSFEGGTFFGIPVFVTGYADTDSTGSVVALVKGDEIFLGDEGGIQVSVSDQATLVMDDAPTGNSITPTGINPAGQAVVSLWQANSIAFLVERFVNWQKRRSQAVTWGRVNWDACAGS